VKTRGSSRQFKHEEGELKFVSTSATWIATQTVRGRVMQPMKTGRGSSKEPSKGEINDVLETGSRL
jgi:hypothetical protein